jgi:hypothetical protein
MQKLSNGAFQFGFTNTPDARFTVLGTTNADVGASNWIVVGLAAEMAPGQFQFTDPKAVKDPQRFYRVRSP